jgi:hypothetical protein
MIQLEILFGGVTSIFPFLLKVTPETERELLTSSTLDLDSSLLTDMLVGMNTTDSNAELLQLDLIMLFS